jgi:carboxymethylenebutenolidase
VAPHLFHRSGDPIVPYDLPKEVMPHLGALSAEGLEADIAATLEHLRRAGFTEGQIGIVGFCMGGSVVVLAAARHRLGAAVSFYGGGIDAGRFGMPPLVELAPELQTSWLGLFGDADQSIPTDQVEMMRQAAATAPVSTEVVRYPEAEHGFHCDARPATYHGTSAKDGWLRTLDWLGVNLARA